MTGERVKFTGIPCPECQAQTGEWCVDHHGGVLASLTHTGRRSLAMVLFTHPDDVDPVAMIREASGTPDAPLWDCVAKIERNHPGGVRRWLGAVGLVRHGGGWFSGDGLPVWFAEVQRRDLERFGWKEVRA